MDGCVSALRRIPLSRCSSCRRKVKARRPPDHRRTQQVGRQEAVCDRSSGLQILMAAGPGGPRVERKQVLILPAHRPTKQVGMQEAVCDRSSGLQILMAVGPCRPGVEERTVKI